MKAMMLAAAMAVLGGAAQAAVVTYYFEYTYYQPEIDENIVSFFYGKDAEASPNVKPYSGNLSFRDLPEEDENFHDFTYLPVSYFGQSFNLISGSMTIAPSGDVTSWNFLVSNGSGDHFLGSSLGDHAKDGVTQSFSYFTENGYWKYTALGCSDWEEECVNVVETPVPASLPLMTFSLVSIFFLGRRARGRQAKRSQTSPIA